jgi:hypothetical protein
VEETTEGSPAEAISQPFRGESSVASEKSEVAKGKMVDTSEIVVGVDMFDVSRDLFGRTEETGFLGDDSSWTYGVTGSFENFRQDMQP